MQQGNSSRRRILCINSGGSSVKVAIYELVGDKSTLLGAFTASGIGAEEGRIAVWDPQAGHSKSRDENIKSHQDAIKLLLAHLDSRGITHPDAIGHRFVKGPLGSTHPAWLENSLVRKLEELASDAPLHLPAELEGVHACRQHFSGVPQGACFDNYFFRDLPLIATRLPLPRWVRDVGIQRIGYHGLSYEYILDRFRPYGRCVIMHLGNGASMVALQNAKPIDTTMSWTPCSGLMMGTRSGDLDPGILISLLRRKEMSVDRLESLLEHESGLFGVSGLSSGMAELLGSDSQTAEEAVDLFCYIARKHLGAMIATAGGIDHLVLTGGIGENSPEVRKRILDGLEDLGIVIDDRRNFAGETVISAENSGCEIRVIPTEEDRMIARHIRDLLEEKNIRRAP